MSEEGAKLLRMLVIDILTLSNKQTTSTPWGGRRRVTGK
jgi:hypothetical protein